VIPTLPLHLRNRLAAAILSALHDQQARGQLAALAAAGARDWLRADEARWTDRVVARARAATTALAERPLLAHDADLAQALRAAATLFEAGLYFEVHEVLEPHWIAAGGDVKEALQGLIQVAVAWQHVANGNVAGARSLLIEGSARLRRARRLGTDLELFARDAAEAADGLRAGHAIRPPRFPRVELDDKEEA
jgi:Domain of unknown function (DUF309)